MELVDLRASGTESDSDEWRLYFGVTMWPFGSVGSVLLWFNTPHFEDLTWFGAVGFSNDDDVCSLAVVVGAARLFSE